MGKAQETIREWEAKGTEDTNSRGRHITIAQASDEFLADAEARNLHDRTIYKYRLLFAI